MEHSLIDAVLRGDGPAVEEMARGSQVNSNTPGFQLRLVNALLHSDSPGMVKRLTYHGLLNLDCVNAEAVLACDEGRNHAAAELVLVGMDVTKIRKPAFMRKAIRILNEALIDTKSSLYAFGLMNAVERTDPAGFHLLKSVVDSYPSGKELLQQLTCMVRQINDSGRLY